jgi:cation/acetate symporter
MTGAFAAGYIGSKLRPDADASRKYEEQKIRNYLGVGAE